MFTELEQDNLQDRIQGDGITMVQYSAGWCGNCRVMKPKFKKHAEEFSNMEFILVDAENFPASRKLASVDNLPTFAAFRDGKIINQIQTNKAESLKEFIDAIANN